MISLKLFQLLEGGGESLPALEEIGPRIFFLHTESKIADVEAGGIQGSLNLGPGEWSGYRRVRFVAHGVWGDDGLHGAIAKGIEVDALAAGRDGMFHGELLGVSSGEAL